MIKFSDVCSKRDYLNIYCDNYKVCNNCPLNQEWCKKHVINSCSEKELDEAISIIQNNKPKDTVNHPSHYTQGSIECIDAMIEAFGKKAVANFCLCNAFKYIWRHDKKGHLEDIKKANWYLEKYLNMNEE